MKKAEQSGRLDDNLFWEALGPELNDCPFDGRMR